MSRSTFFLLSFLLLTGACSAALDDPPVGRGGGGTSATLTPVVQPAVSPTESPEETRVRQRLSELDNELTEASHGSDIKRIRGLHTEQAKLKQELAWIELRKPKQKTLDPAKTKQLEELATRAEATMKASEPGLKQAKEDAVRALHELNAEMKPKADALGERHKAAKQTENSVELERIRSEQRTLSTEWSRRQEKIESDRAEREAQVYRDNRSR